MIITSLVLFSVMVLFSSAAPYSPPAPVASNPVTHYVNVSNSTAGLLYDPPYINASTGDIVSFLFHPKNHTVTQSSFDAPCTPRHGGADTGFVAVAPGTNDTDLPTRSFVVEDAQPIWIHCRQGEGTPTSHCGQGMVFAINPEPEGSKKSFSAFQKKARATLKQSASNYTSITKY